MASHDGRLFSKWAWPLLILASTASALSFTSIQPIVSANVPLGCILAYGTEIPGCSLDDFQEGIPCSRACVRGMVRIESLLQAACGDADDISPTSVLGQVLLGNTVQMLCPGNSNSPETPTPSPSRRPTAEPTTAPTTRTSSRGPLTLTTVRRPSTSSAAATETDEPDTSTSTSSATSTAALDTPTPTVIESSTPTSESAAASSTPTESAEEETVDNSSGGGSPFDFVSSSDSRQLPTCWMEAVTVALGLGLLLLR